MTSCQKMRPGATVYAGKQGFSYVEGISKERMGAQGLCMHLLTIPPGGRAKAHKHATHETAIYALSGTSAVFHGAHLEHHETVAPGDFFYIPADVPHLPYNPSGTEPAVALGFVDSQDSSLGRGVIRGCF